MNNIAYILIIIIALGIVAVALAIRRKKAPKQMSGTGMLSLFLVIAGIVFANDIILGYGLISLGLIFALIDIFKKERAKQDFLEGFNEERKWEKEQAKQKILQSIEAQKSITNDAAQSLLGVSDATATRYLEELEKEGKIKQVGKTGHSVFYEKILKE